jgi:glycosyltransferase involved in cell wall biosynthesis
MKIAFDARYISTTETDVLPAGGIGRYSYHLLRWMCDLDVDLELLLIVPGRNRRPIFPRSKVKIREIPFQSSANSFSTLFRLAGMIDFADQDLFHSPFNMMPLNLPCPSVVTLHDIMWLTQPELCAGFLPERILAGTLYQFGIKKALHMADHIITISEASRNEIVHYKPEVGNRISVIHHGMDPFFTVMEPERVDTLLASLLPGAGGKKQKEFVLCVGQGSPYKNHVRAVLGFLKAFGEREDIQLVLVNRFKRFDWKMWELLGRKVSREKIVLLESVTDDELLALYNRARIFLFPSLVEGFGMPQLEAMACGTPVLTSDRGAPAEISGGNSFLVDPESVEAIAGGLLELDGNERLRLKLAAAGRKRVKDFLWKSSAEKTLAVYRSIIDSDGFKRRSG